MPAVLRDIDAAKAFYLVVNEITLLSSSSLGFPKSLTAMIGKLWSGLRCHVKTAFGVSTEFYKSTLTELFFRIG
jgi:hypothetical protein